MDKQRWSRKTRWSVGVVSFVVIGMLTLAAFSLNNWFKPTWHAAPSPTASQSPTPTVGQLQAAQDKIALDAYLVLYGPAYNCADDRNKSAKRIADLMVCPLYVATVKMTGNLSSQPPVIITPMDNTGKKLIDITTKHVAEWQTLSDTKQWVWVEYWTITVKCDPRIFPAGGNEHYTQNVTDHPGQWTGPAGIGECNKSFSLTAVTTESVEIYGADPKLKFKGNALPLEKYGKR